MVPHGELGRPGRVSSRIWRWRTPQFCVHTVPAMGWGGAMVWSNSALALVLALGLLGPAAAQSSPAKSAEIADRQRAPGEGGVRRWQVVAAGARLTATPSAGAKTVSEQTAGAVLSNLGCAEVRGAVWCKVRPFRGGASGHVEATALAPAKGPDGVIASGKDDSERRARRRKFDGRAVIPCAQEVGEALGACKGGVARSAGGDATVIATFANGFARRLYFAHGEFIGANTTMSGTGDDISSELVDGVYRLRVDDQRFELPHEFVFGKPET